jgi:hypothetical protein
MLSFFSRFTNVNNKWNTNYNTNLSKYIIDTTNKIKEKEKEKEKEKDKNSMNINDNIIQYHYNDPKCDCDFSIIPIFSMISFLAGYYLSKYNN